MDGKSGLQTQNATPKPAFSLSQPGLLQRTCACGGTPGFTGECQECSSKQFSRQRGPNLPPPPVEDDTSESAGKPLDLAALMSRPQPNYSFNRPGGQPQRPPVVQRKLAIGQPGDRYEQEADRVAEQVMRMPDPKGIAQNITRWEGRQTSEGWFPPTGSIQRKCSGCATEEDEAQAKLSVSKPNDPLEQEADRFAEQVMHAQTPTASRGAAPAVQRDALDDAVQQAERIDEEEEEETQPQTTRPGTALAKRRGMEPQTLPVNAIPRSGGHTLEPEVQHFFSERTGLDFAHVRIHADAEAAASASRLAARAYTVGSNIYFGRGEYRPESLEGRTLLAHELAHVVQQSQGQVQPRMKAGPLSMSAAPPSVLRQLLPPGNCIQGIHDAMQREVKAWCDHPSGRACTAGESCLRLLQKIRRNQLCARNRRTINDLCYNGGDAGHRIAELDARRAQATCMALFRASCTPPPVPVRQPERAPERAPNVDRGFMERMAAITGLTGTALIVYLIISEGSRLFPPRNLVPVP